MSGYKIVILPLAEEDITACTDYIAYELRNPDAAVNMARGFRKTINSLSRYPRRHELDEDEKLKKYGIRKIYYKNYKIYFLIDEQEQVVYILRIFHMLENSRNKIINFLKEKFY